ncbi:diguanylate cyclase (GGDEF)-like protein [Ochrobactrum daejeonense]|uniref:Diguanylate cyclase (GGDEF)-like protein n=1 Tax=Brucella daejeonensis TaxID=659015 RepID=A0A7W9AYB7_9HYPH|nr:bifunctional diguanylate cyclase/phosphodiesterase [Brucella daejeonensis]MBB5702863.1 diguanylate cyclase (GGDEF)-like protein [Brucella daejeonensis]
MGSKIRYWLQLAKAAYSRQEGHLADRIMADQLRDICEGMRFSMPISSTLSVLILLVQITHQQFIVPIVWFVLVNLINGIRFIDAVVFYRSMGAPDENAAAIERKLARFRLLALLSGMVWAGVAILSHGFTVVESPVYLVILAGICAGAVIFSSSHAAVGINFITPPLIVTAACLMWQATLQYGVLAFSIVLFWFGITRGVLLGQHRFTEASRLKHEAKQSADEMALKSQEDPLTGLFNRRGLESSVRQFSAQEGPFIVMLIDLDGFKSVNDTYGHKMGDDLLVAIAQRVGRVAPERSVLARIGGDEFVLVYPEPTTGIEAGLVAARIIGSVTAHYQGILSVEIGACVGICRLDRIDPVDMLLRADFALYAAKKRGRNEYFFFEKHLQHEWERKRSIERDLRIAIETGQIQTFFQPVVELSSGQIVGFEALLRWDHPQHGAIAPPEIIDVACQVGVVRQLTHNVFFNCCEMIDRLLESGRGDLTVAMNLSPRELAGGRIPHEILSQLEKRKLPASMLEIEVTEDAPFDQRGVNDSLVTLASAGLAIALDDFGTGFATFASLKKGIVTKIKIDKVFVRGIAASPRDQHMVRAMVEMGKALGIKVTAEGIETEDDRKTLCRLGCNSGQGFLFSSALPMQAALNALSVSAIRALRHGGAAR